MVAVLAIVLGLSLFVSGGSESEVGGPTPSTSIPAIPDQQYHETLDGEVSFYSQSPWEESLTGPQFGEDVKLYLFEVEGALYVLPDPISGRGCPEDPVAADAAAFADSVLSDEDLESGAPVVTTIGGAPALRMDLVMRTAEEPVHCEGPPRVLARSHLTGGWFGAGDHIRLYIVDLPEGSSAEILTIAVGGPEPHFEEVVEQAAPILDSFEFQAG
jgi:hypothetical protein